MKYYSGLINKLENNQIFVFGSNPEGRHGAGAAKIALNNYGAIYGQGRGLQGQSYALPTKNLKEGYYEKISGITYEKSGLKSISIEQIKNNIKEFYDFANDNKDLEFLVVYTLDGKNLNGYSGEEMFDMFNSYNIPSNIVFNISFKKLFDIDYDIKKREKEIQELKSEIHNLNEELNELK